MKLKFIQLAAIFIATPFLTLAKDPFAGFYEGKITGAKSYPLQDSPEVYGRVVKNADGTYTVIMRINNDITTLMELKLVVANRQLAKYLYKSWVDKASTTYSLIYDNLIE